MKVEKVVAKQIEFWKFPDVLIITLKTIYKFHSKKSMFSRFSI